MINYLECIIWELSKSKTQLLMCWLVSTNKKGEKDNISWTKSFWVLLLHIVCKNEGIAWQKKRNLMTGYGSGKIHSWVYRISEYFTYFLFIKKQHKYFYYLHGTAEKSYLLVQDEVSLVCKWYLIIYLITYMYLDP